MKITYILVPLLFVGLAPAATVFMRFETTLNTTAYGGAAATPLVVTYSFDSELAPGTGPFGVPGSYGPLASMEIQLGSQTVSGTVGSGITILNDSVDGDQYDVRVTSPTGTVFGEEIDLFRFLITDPSGSMFSDTGLPTSFNFSSTSGFFQITEFLLDNPFNPPPLGVNETASTPLGERTPFTLTVIPEPSPLAIFGIAALGAAWIRRRGRR